jgi:tight adherence protein B
LQRATGGNLATTLDILSDIMRKRRAMRLKGKAVTGEVRMSAYVLAAIPFVVIGGLLIASPDYLQPLISDRRGNVIVGLAVGSLIAGFATIRQMMRSVTQV